ncbi:transposable element tc3 transposase [Histomonas meleagridis]|uniref:transposable element tc3 transposase n=1 Tax=Histomonas meleagridis TaxID=135588 RepID=UPI003559B55E|nr:transposable element tc3 transposase [Histomonas meleagridis]KAH0798975.1 transposable element tc3 transposase [Histomonas meleagridis]
MVCAEKVAHPKKVMIRGAIGLNFKSKLVFIEGPVSSDIYFEQIIIGSGLLTDADNVYGHEQWVLQQDNARPHIANDVIQSLDYLDVLFIDDWPPYSPDLNIIEVVWAIMKRRLEAKIIRSIDELKNVIIDVWNNLSLETINRLVLSMPAELQACVANQGNTILHL